MWPVYVGNQIISMTDKKIDNKYPEPIKDDLYTKDEQVDINPYPTFDQIINWKKSLYEDNKQNNP